MTGAPAEFQFVTLGLGDEVFAVPVEQVREILRAVKPAKTKVKGTIEPGSIPGVN